MNKNLKTGLVVVAIAALAYWFYKKSKAVTVAVKTTDPTPAPTPEPEPDPIPDPILPPPSVPYVLPAGVVNGSRIHAEGDDTQWIIEDNKRWGITWEQWVARNWDAPTIKFPDTSILYTIPNGGTWRGGLIY
jgi:hypothetical protein